MNVFVLCTGRSGSTTFAKAAAHISNYTSGHEERARLLGAQRLAYPPNHIEADNRLTWMLGRLDEAFGPRAFYVHLTRSPDRTAQSFNERWNDRFGIISAYRNGILMGSDEDAMAICNDYVETVNANIRAFLKDKPEQMHFELEFAARDWPVFWKRIDAKGDFAASLREWEVSHNAARQNPRRTSLIRRTMVELRRRLNEL